VILALSIPTAQADEDAELEIICEAFTDSDSECIINRAN